ncbi:MAG: hypothetical protein HRT45_09420 [Bdellovibrionales bacterium]|nr:hypothetical protein [Bdellovibrionales bacterium]
MYKLFVTFGTVALLAIISTSNSFGVNEEEADPVASLGERLFLEHRFSQFFYVNSGGSPNKGLEEGDPTLDFVDHFNGNQYPGPFAGQAMSCATCHMIDQGREVDSALGTRIYSDFSTRSPISARNGRGGVTLRNSQSAVLPQNENGPNFLHWDGEFNSFEMLTLMGFAGRNMGWLPSERRTAHHHVARIIREDDGSGELAEEFGGFSYTEIFLSEDPAIPADLRLPEELRLDVSTASPHQIMMRVAFVVSEYMRGSSLSKDENDEYNGSPYDLFLRKNDLPLSAADGETDLEYSQRLLKAVEELEFIQFVSKIDNNFSTHDQEYSFGPDELTGLKLFLTLESDPSQNKRASSCASCHTPPHFIDFGFHNVGISQLGYERENGFNSFRRLYVPDLTERNENMDKYGPATPRHPERQRLLGSQPTRDNPNKADLGVWNHFRAPGFDHLQDDLTVVLQKSLPSIDLTKLNDDEILAKTIGMMKTPTLRDLGHTAPYFHDGHARGLSQVVSLYIATSRGARQGLILNPDPKLLKINLQEADKEPLVKFLMSLNEDYE